jgi:hypothetical protein
MPRDSATNLALEPALLQQAREALLEDVEVERLRQEIVRAAPHGLDRGLDRPVGGDDEEVDEGMAGAGPPEER